MPESNDRSDLFVDGLIPASPRIVEHGIVYRIHGMNLPESFFQHFSFSPEQAESMDRSTFERAVQIFSRVNNRYTGFDEAVPSPSATDYFNGFAMSNRVRILTKDIIDTPLTKEAEETLRVALQKIFETRNEYLHLIAQRNRGDSRAREYQENYVNNKNFNPFETVYSEFPLSLEYLGPEQIQIIRDLCHVEGFKQKDKAFCEECYRVMHPHFLLLMGGKLYCAEHVPNHTLCHFCGELANTSIVATFDGKELRSCPRCIQNRGRCKTCSTAISPMYMEVRRCERCLNTGEHGEGPLRPFSFGLARTSEKTGSILQSSRFVSAEIEGTSELRNAIGLLSAKLPPDAGISGDGSVRGAHPFEIQTPRLSGDLGEEFVNRVSGVLRTIKGEVNESCGLHVHIDGHGVLNVDRRAYPKELVQLWKAYLIFEDVILSLIPYRRRMNPYSRTLMGAFSLLDLDTINNLPDAEKLWYRNNTYSQIHQSKRHHYHASRYFGVNFHPLFGSSHFEIRYHGGTMNAKKILHWANLHALIADAAVAGKFTAEVLREAQMSSLGEKTKLLFDVIGLSSKGQSYFRERQDKFSNKNNDEN